MNVYSRSVVLLLLSFCTFDVTEHKKERIQIHNPRLDIALLFDESESMVETNYQFVYNGIREWVNGYFIGKRATETRFAVIGCGGENVRADTRQDPPRLTFSDGQTANEIIAKVKDPQQKKFWDNVGICLERADKFVFRQNVDRPDAPNVILYVSDCNYTTGTSYNRTIVEDLANKVEDVTNRMILKNQADMTGFFSFICLENKNRDQEGYNNVLKMVGGDSRRVLKFESVPKLRSDLDVRLPKIWVDVEHCEDEVRSTGCVYNLMKGECEETLHQVIIVDPYPPDHARPCQHKSTVTTPCHNCVKPGMSTTTSIKTTTMPTSQAKSTLKDGHGKWTPTEYSGLTETSEDVTSNVSVTSDASAGGLLQDSTEEYNSTLYIGIAVGAFILLLLLLLLILLIVLNRQKKKAAKKKLVKTEGGSVLKGKEKMKGVEADLDYTDKNILGKSAGGSVAGGKAKLKGVQADIDTRRSKVSEKTKKSHAKKSPKSSAKSSPKTSPLSSPSPSRKHGG